MEALYFGSWNAQKNGGWCGGAGAGPWIMADLEDGLWNCATPRAINPLSQPVTAAFVVGMVKGGSASWGLKVGDAGGGALVTTWDGPRPPGYQVRVPPLAICCFFAGASLSPIHSPHTFLAHPFPGAAHAEAR